MKLIKVLFIWLLPICLAGQVQYYASTPQMQVLTLKKGKQAFWDGSLPYNLLGKTRKIESVQGVFAFHPECKYDFGADKDQWDWNKLVGVQFFQGLKGLFNPNLNNIMIAWRYNPEVSSWEVTPYINRNKKFETGHVIRIKDPYTKVSYYLTRERGSQWSITLAAGEIFLHQQFKVNEKRKARLIQSWFGGADNDPDGLPYGGKAPHDMSLSLSCEIIK